MMAVLRGVAAIVAGLTVAFVLVVAVELFSSVVHPLPEGFGGTSDEMCQHVERYPAWVLAVVIPMWAVTAFAGVWTARRLGSVLASGIVGFVLLAALILNLAMLPYPIWFKAGTLIAVFLAILTAMRGGGTSKSSEET